MKTFIYPQAFIRSAAARRAPREPSNEDDNETENPPVAFLPYVAGVTEKIRKVCRDFGIKAVFKSGPTLRGLLTKANTLRGLFLVLNFFHHSLNGGSLDSNDGTSRLTLCPGDVVMYNCTVVSTPGGVTVWQGEAFDCQNGEITLLHSQFATLSGATGECNNGDLVARSLGVEDSRYTSQLRVTVSTAITENMIMCVHDTSRGNILPQFNTTIPGLVTDAGPLPPPNNVHVSVANFVSGELTFTWSPVLSHCSSSISYSILASNCGHCPTNTTSATVTCTDAFRPTNGSVCTFAVQTILCGTVVGNSSEPINIITVNESGSSRSTSMPLSSAFYADEMTSSITYTVSSVTHSEDYGFHDNAENMSGIVVTNKLKGNPTLFSTIVLAVLLVLCVIVFITSAIIIQEKFKRKLKILKSQSSAANIDTTENIAYDTVAHYDIVR